MAWEMLPPSILKLVATTTGNSLMSGSRPGNLSIERGRIVK
jgi:hypothetical protein